jgi:hypothetical protein
MSLTKNDVKHGIDVVADHLKNATESVARTSADTADKIAEKGRELALKTGDELIEQGQKLKHAATKSEDTPTC